MTRSNFRPKISHAFLRNYRSCVLKFNYNSQRRDTASSASLHPPSFSHSHLALTASEISGYSAFVNSYGRKLSIPQNVIFRLDSHAKQNRPGTAMWANYISFILSPLSFLFALKFSIQKEDKKTLVHLQDTSHVKFRNIRVNATRSTRCRQSMDLIKEVSDRCNVS